MLSYGGTNFYYTGTHQGLNCWHKTWDLFVLQGLVEDSLHVIYLDHLCGSCVPEGILPSGNAAAITLLKKIKIKASIGAEVRNIQRNHDLKNCIRPLNLVMRVEPTTTTYSPMNTHGLYDAANQRVRTHAWKNPGEEAPKSKINDPPQWLLRTTNRHHHYDDWSKVLEKWRNFEEIEDSWRGGGKGTQRRTHLGGFSMKMRSPTKLQVLRPVICQTLTQLEANDSDKIQVCLSPFPVHTCSFDIPESLYRASISPWRLENLQGNYLLSNC